AAIPQRVVPVRVHEYVAVGRPIVVGGDVNPAGAMDVPAARTPNVARVLPDVDARGVDVVLARGGRAGAGFDGRRRRRSVLHFGLGGHVPEPARSTPPGVHFLTAD